MACRQLILATGGYAGAYPQSTNPTTSRGEALLPAWSVLQVSPGEGQTFPENQLQYEVQGHRPSFEILHLGNYYFSLFLKVVWVDGLEKVFRVDPEMVVTNNGPLRPLSCAPES